MAYLEELQNLLDERYIYIYIYISEVEGKEALADLNREIGFGFVSCSCRACVRAGEAKLRERVRDDALSSLGSAIATFPSPAFSGEVLCPRFLML